MKRFLAMLLVLCFLLVGVNTMAFAAESTGDAQSTQNTNSTEAVANVQSADGEKTAETTGSAWEYETPMDESIIRGSAASYNGKIYFTGGTNYDGNNKIFNTLRIYDTISKTWSTGAPFSENRFAHLSKFYNGKLYIFGGMDVSVSNYLKSLEIYDTTTNKWSKGSDMPYPAFDSSSVLVGNKIYVFGTGIPKQQPEKVQIYDIDNDKWTLGNSMPLGVCDSISGAVGNNIYILGGLLSGVNDFPEGKDKIYVYNTETDSWSFANSKMLKVNTNSPSLTIGEKIYVFNFDYDKKQNSLLIYNTKTDVWNELSFKPIISKTDTVVSSVGNKVYIIGGIDYVTRKNTNTVESFVTNDTDTTPQLSILLNQGESVKLSVSKTSADNSKYTWTSSDEKVATVDANGLVSAINTGKANIYAENAETKFKEYIPVVVVEGTADETRLAVNLDLNQTKQLYLNDDTKNITWSSNDESICTVADGIITAKKNGLAIIKATYNDKTYQMYVRVTNA